MFELGVCIIVVMSVFITIFKVLGYLKSYALNYKDFFETVKRLVLSNYIDRSIKVCNTEPSNLLSREVIKPLLVRANKGHELIETYQEIQLKLDSGRGHLFFHVLNFLLNVFAVVIGVIALLKSSAFLVVVIAAVLDFVVAMWVYWRMQWLHRKFKDFGDQMFKLLLVRNHMAVSDNINLKMWSNETLEQQTSRMTWFEENWEQLKEDEYEEPDNVYNRVIGDDGLLPDFEGGVA